MLQIRLTILRDRPASDLLRQYAICGYHLFQDLQTGLFFLCDGDTSRFAASPFWGGYDPVLYLPHKFDTGFLDDFRAEHADTFVDYLDADPDIIKDAVALSQLFSTRVMSAYANDEGDDFAVTAENGELISLRFEAGRKRGPRLPDTQTRELETESPFRLIHKQGKKPADIEVFEYTAYVGIKTQDQDLSLWPYWHYLEGNVFDEVIFQTIHEEPGDHSPRLMFRNVFIEFEEAFNQPSPDFTDTADPDRFAQIEFKAPLKPSLNKVALKPVINLIAYLLAKPKRMQWAGFILLLLLAGIFGERFDGRTQTRSDDRTRTQIMFSDHCDAADGTVLSEDQDLCIVGDQIYRNWNLPGKTGERRPMAFIIGQARIPCTDGSKRMCLEVNDKPFDMEIGGVEVIEGQTQIVFVERIQRCDPKTDQNCSTPAEMFEFSLRRNLSK